jgi:hypothetical protein
MGKAFPCVNKTASILNYDAKPLPIFQQEPTRGTYTMGIELEIELHPATSESTKTKVVRAIKHILKHHGYIKHDGSLTNGVEIVSYPAPLVHHLYSAPWKTLMEFLLSIGCASERAGSCGMHVHMNRNFFKLEDAVIISKLLDVHSEKILKMTRRDDAWNKKYSKFSSDTGMSTTDTLQEKYKYMALRRTPSTYEIRCLNGTLHYEKFMALMQLVDVLVKASKDRTDILEGIKEYPQLNALWNNTNVFEGIDSRGGEYRWTQPRKRV